MPILNDGTGVPLKWVVGPLSVMAALGLSAGVYMFRTFTDLHGEATTQFAVISEQVDNIKGGMTEMNATLKEIAEDLNGTKRLEVRFEEQISALQRDNSWIRDQLAAMGRTLDSLVSDR